MAPTSYAIRDENRVTTALALKDDDSGVVPLQIDPATGRLLASITVE